MKRQKQQDVDAVRNKLRTAAKASGLTQEEIGIAMGFKRPGARQAVSRLLNAETEYDPRLSTLLEFAKAVKRPLRELM
jgi:transcriptional regulator with XRE-family HTH domain